jgi:hypothetical protein
MSLADQVTVTYVVVGIAVGVEVLLARLFGIYATFGSLDTLIGTSVLKSAAGAILTVALMRLGMHLLRPRGAER